MNTTRKRWPVLACLLALGLLLTRADGTQAADLYVPGQYATIQAAINAASDGDTIHVAAGTYTENITWSSKSLILQGAGAGQSLIDGGKIGSCLVLSGVPSTARIDGFTIQNGYATFGGGMYNYFSNPVVTNCTFSGNTASGGDYRIGGGMGNWYSSPMVTHCTFSKNSAYGTDGGIGGGMGNWHSSPMVTHCTFSGNSESGMFNYYSTTSLTNCTFSGNIAFTGGGMDNYLSTTTLTNCTFSGNSAGNGGGMFNENSTQTLTNCTFSGNIAYYGGGMINYNSSPTVTNCILWGDSGGEIYGGGITITHSDVQGGYTGSGNINIDPRFVRTPGTNGDNDFGDLHLQAGSPCIDAGDNSVVTVPPFPADDLGNPLDLDGNPRLSHGNVDLGAYEYAPLKNVTAQVSLVRGGIRYNRATGRFVQSVSVLNNGATVAGPVSLVLGRLPQGVTLFNPSGLTQVFTPAGRPYLNLWSGEWQMGNSVTVTLEFTDPAYVPITYTTRVLAGYGQR